MGRLIYSTITSLDGYVADETAGFEWAVPDDEVHGFVNDLVRTAGTHLYGRRLYDVMVAWEDVPDEDSVPAVERDFGRLWRAADKVVYSRTLPAVRSARTTLEREFDPDAVRRRKDATDGDLVVGGTELAGTALLAGLVDEVQLLVAPVLVGGGTWAWPRGLRSRLELRDTRRFGNGMVHVRYDVVPGDPGGAQGS